MSKYGYEVSTAPAYLEIHRYRMRQRRKKYLLLGLMGVLLLILFYTNRRAILGNYRKVILGSVSFETIDKMFQRDNSPILVIHPDGKRIDTISNAKTYKVLFFAPEFANLEHKDSENDQLVIKTSSKLDPLVDLSSEGETSRDEKESNPENDEDELIDLNEIEVYIDDGKGDDELKGSRTETDASLSEITEITENTAYSEASISEGETDNTGDVQTRDSNHTTKAPEVPEKIQTRTRTLPGFPGGLRALTQYINEHMQYPQLALDSNVEGVVYISFMIDQQGEVENPSVFKGLGYGCDEEALRLVSEMPRWIPGSKDGLPIDMSYTLPITFRLQ